jgi:hypothetical protein
MFLPLFLKELPVYYLTLLRIVIKKLEQCVFQFFPTQRSIAVICNGDINVHHLSHHRSH